MIRIETWNSSYLYSREDKILICLSGTLAEHVFEDMELQPLVVGARMISTADSTARIYTTPIVRMVLVEN